MEVSEIKKNIEKILDDNKAQSITTIDLKNKSYIADYMIIASGTSSRHLQSLSEILVAELKKQGIEICRIEGRNSNDWKLVDTQDFIVHIFHPEYRIFYDLEKNGIRRSGGFDFYVNHSIDDAHIVVQEPLVASNFIFSEKIHEDFKDQHGINLKRIHVNNYTSNTTKSITFTYDNPSQDISINSLQKGFIFRVICI